MSKQIASSGPKQRTDLLAELGRQVRLSQIASDKMDDAFSARAGVNLTDGRCIDLLDVLGGMTAGELRRGQPQSCRQTAVLDRLERSGLVTRTRDERDRRRVIVELTAEAHSLAAEIYGPLAGYAAPYLEELSNSELKVIVRFLAISSEINERRAASCASRPQPTTTLPVACPAPAEHRLRLAQPTQVVGALHARHDQPLDLGRALEDLVDLGVPEPLLERAVAGLGERADEVHQRRGRPHRHVLGLQLDIEPWPPVIGIPLRPIQAARQTSSRAASISVATSASVCWMRCWSSRGAPSSALSSR